METLLKAVYTRIYFSIELKMKRYKWGQNDSLQKNKNAN